VKLDEILSTRPTSLVQPGPHLAGYTYATSEITMFETELPAGVSLHESLAQMVAERGLAGAHMRFANMQMAQLEYVMPDLSPDDTHVAWYSEVRKLSAPAIIEQAAINCGVLNGSAYYHCHGAWSEVGKATAMGHLLPESSAPATAAQVAGFGFKHARFNRVHDPETAFDLFVPEQLHVAPEAPNAILLRINPNVEIERPLIELCQKYGWKQASVHGLGSLIGAAFEDGRVMNSFATEAVINKGFVNMSGASPEVSLDVSLVGLDGKFMGGKLARASNPVMITFEIVLVKVA